MSARSWYVGRWGPLGWVETALKAAAQVTAFVAFAQAAGDGLSWPDGGLRRAQLILLSVLSLGLVAAIADRIAMREVISMAFVIPNVLAHLAMVAAIASVPGPGGQLVVFCLLMITGELVKIGFFATSGMRVRDVAPRVVIGLTAVYAAGYLAILLIELGR